MAGAVQLTEVDFEQIKDNLVNYLKSTEKFTDYDFDGSNLSVILNLIAYQAQLNSYSTNMVANESFLTTASLRDNVVASARQVGYTPTSARAAMSFVTLEFDLNADGNIEDKYPMGLPQYLEFRPGGILSAKTGGDSYTFNNIDIFTAGVNMQGVATFENIPVYEGFLIETKFTVDLTDFNQRFVLGNKNIDSTTIRIEVQEDPNELSTFTYKEANNITTLNQESRVYWLEESKEGSYELTFGDGYFGKPLVDGAIINVSYLITDGPSANGIKNVNSLTYKGTVYDSNGTAILDRAEILNMTSSDGGSTQESIPSIKFRAPKSYSAQNRCVTAADYETIIRNIYPGIDDMYVYGGETLDLPEYGRVYVVIKPKSGEYLSNASKVSLQKSLEPYRVASLDIVFQDPEILYVECETIAYYNPNATLKDSTAIIGTIKNTLTEFKESSIVSSFGGTVRYSRILGAVDDSDTSITRNTTKLRMRKNMVVAENTEATYEICFSNPLLINHDTAVVYSTGFYLPDDEEIYYFENIPQPFGETTGFIQRFHFNDLNEKIVDDKNFGVIDFVEGEINLGLTESVNIASTVIGNGIIEVRSYPREVGQDIEGKGNVYLSFDVAKSDIQATIDSQSTGS